MKRFFCVIITAIILALNLCLFTACNGGENDSPEYSEIYSYNENLHWRNQLNGNGRTDVGDHINDRGKCNVCNYYFDASEYISYVKVKFEDKIYYTAYEYKGTVGNPYVNIEIPAQYKGRDDDAPIPVIAVNAYMFAPSQHVGLERIKSFKLNEGLRFIGRGAFNGTLIKEAIVPDSVTNGFNSIAGLKFDEQGNQVGVATLSGTNDFLYNVFSSTPIVRAVIGNGVKGSQGYLFSSCSQLEEVILGNSVTRLATRDFYCCPELKTLIIPASLDTVRESHIWSNAVDKYVSLYNIFEGSKGFPDIFTYMTKERYKSDRVKK